MMYGLANALYKAGEKAVGGKFLLLGITDDELVLPVFWRKN